ncbi:MAG: hypothetical protein KF784_14300 [Fimbriimonadaceae bacterium]|nr:hypothetical protein [Fimbriimonadaceae bacterium]
MDPLIQEIKDLSIIVAGAVALITLIRGVREYAHQGRERRAVQFVNMRRRFLETVEYQQILELLRTDDPRLTQIPHQQRRNFIGFLEEIALMMNSQLIRPEIAHYMFGYYVRMANHSEYLWHELERPSIYWEVFRTFAGSMEAESQKFPSVKVPLRL